MKRTFAAWGTAARIALRDLGHSRTTLLFASAVCFSMAAVTAVAALGSGFDAALRADLRVWLGADIAAQSFEPLTQQQQVAMKAWTDSGITATTVVSTATSASSDESPDPVMVMLRAVDPAVYPLYGNVTLDPPQSPQLLTAGSVAVSSEVLRALHARLGGSLRIGIGTFRIAALLREEPDRLMGMPPALGPHVLVTEAGLEQSGVARAAYLHYRTLLRLPRGADLTYWRRQVEGVFPEAEVLDFREPDSQAAEVLEDALDFLRVMSLIVLLLGSVAAAAATREFVALRMEAIAILRVLGARYYQIAGIYGLSLFVLAAAATLIGVTGGLALARYLGGFLGYFVPVGKPSPLSAVSALLPLALALGTVGLVIVRELRAIRDCRPASILRGETQSAQPRGSLFALVAGAGLLLCWSLFGSWRFALAFVGVITAGGVLVFAGSRAALRALHRMPVPSAIQLGPQGKRTFPLVAALAAGITLVVSAVAGRNALVEEIRRAVPASESNLFVLGIPGAMEQTVEGFLAAQPGLIGRPETLHLAWLRLLSVDGREPDSAGLAHRPVNRMWLSSCSGQIKSGVELAASVAAQLDAHAGSMLDLSGNGRHFQARVSAVRPVDSVRKIWQSLSFPCPSFAGQNVLHHIAARIDPARLDQVRRAAGRRFPGSAVATGDELFEAIRGTAEIATSMLATMSWLIVGAEVVVLIAFVSASEAERRREIAIWKALGARAGVVARLITLQLSISTLVAAGIGTVLGYLVAGVVLVSLVGRWPFAFSWLSAGGIAAGAVLVVNFAGWMCIYPALRVRPMDLVRGE